MPITHTKYEILDHLLRKDMRNRKTIMKIQLQKEQLLKQSMCAVYRHVKHLCDEIAENSDT